MILTDELCDKLCTAAREKSKEIGIDISFAISDENGLPKCNKPKPSLVGKSAIVDQKWRF